MEYRVYLKTFSVFLIEFLISSTFWIVDLCKRIWRRISIKLFGVQRGRAISSKRRLIYYVYEKQSAGVGDANYRKQILRLLRNIKQFDIHLEVQQVEKNPQLLKLLFASFEVRVDSPKEMVQQKSLKQKNKEYKDIQKIFFKYNKNCFNIQKIEKINNPFLLLHYNIKKLKCKWKKREVKEKTLFHGTSKDNVKSIIENNFNWRLYGTNRGNRFGQGVSFSSCPSYASNYGDLKEDVKVMIAAKVLIGKSCTGNKNTYIPRPEFDTTTNPKKQVFVKYEDHEFYPAYIIYYQGKDETQQENNYEMGPRLSITLGDFIYSKKLDS